MSEGDRLYEALLDALGDRVDTEVTVQTRSIRTQLAELRDSLGSAEGRIGTEITAQVLTAAELQAQVDELRGEMLAVRVVLARTISPSEAKSLERLSSTMREVLKTMKSDELTDSDRRLAEATEKMLRSLADLASKNRPLQAN